MIAADPQAPRTLDRLARDAKAIAAQARGVLGVEPDDLVAAGWLAYVGAAERGLQHAGCAARARFAMIDAVREWIGTPWDHQTGASLATMVPLREDGLVEPTPSAGARSRLPRRVRRALTTLTPRERAALHCWTVRGWSHDLIAAHLGVSVGTSGRLRHEALAQLRAVAGVPCDTPQHHRTGRHNAPAGRGSPARAARTSSPSAA